MTVTRWAIVSVLIAQGCLLEDGRTGSDDAGLDALGSGGSGGSGGSSVIDGGVGGSGGSNGGAGGATTGTGGTAGSGATTGTGGAAGATGTGGSATGGGAGSGGAAGSGGKGGTAGTGGSTVVDSGVDARVADASDARVVDTVVAPDRSGGDACANPTLDTDADGTPDCTDGCPRDARKTQPGTCGCGLPDPASGDGGQLGCLSAALVHRYSFNGTGDADASAGISITDSIGTAHGTARGGATLANGTLSLTGDRGANYTTEGYVNLPADVLSGLTNATFEVWVTWRGAAGGTGANWQRIFDFGDQQGSNGRTYLFLSPSSGSNTLRMTWSANGSANETVIDQPALPIGMVKHVAVVIDDSGATASLCIDGECTGTTSLSGALRGITPTNNWLGRSNYSVDPELNGILHEFRIYNAPLPPAIVRASFTAGPDVAF